MFTESLHAINKLKQSQDIDDDNIWKNSQFKELNDLKIDYSGKVGELAFFNFLSNNTNWDIIYKSDSNTNNNDGVYDGLVNEYRVEVKTARVGKGKTFQHENLKQSNECDFVVFVDYTPNYFFLTVKDFRNINLDEKIEVFNIKAHKRKATNNIYKLDLRENTSIKLAIDNGISIKIDSNTNNYEILAFLHKFFVV